MKQNGGKKKEGKKSITKQLFNGGFQPNNICVKKLL